MYEDFFTDSTYYTGEPLTTEMVRQAEKTLGYRLPQAYVDLLKVRNGGVPTRKAVPTTFKTSWAPDHFQVKAIRGIGGEWGIDSTSGLGNADMIREWGYPNIGVVIGQMPSGGHDTIMLDYSASGPDGEPAVVYIDEDRVPRRVADNFSDFLAKLVPTSQFESQ